MCGQMVITRGGGAMQVQIFRPRDQTATDLLSGKKVLQQIWGLFFVYQTVIGGGGTLLKEIWLSLNASEERDTTS